MSVQEYFEEVYNKTIKRAGADKLLSYLEKSDFFQAPASTKYHLSVSGGLATHSLHVYQRLKRLYSMEFPDRELTAEEEEKIAICGLLHDCCKIGFYKTDYRNKKNDAGTWEKVPVFIVEDKLPFGHGEKSYFIISQFIHLTVEEAMAIRWHMGFSDEAAKGGSYALGTAFSKYPLAVLLHMADLSATYLDETKFKENQQQKSYLN